MISSLVRWLEVNKPEGRQQGTVISWYYHDNIMIYYAQLLGAQFWSLWEWLDS